MLTSNAVAIAFLSLGWLPTGYKWNNGQLPVPYCLMGNATQTNLSAAQQQSEVRKAINTWISTGAGGRTSCSFYNAVQETGTCRPTVDLNDGQNNIFWNRSWTQGSQVLGVTHYWGSGNCGRVGNTSLDCIAEADIEFNDKDVFWDNAGRQTDVAAIAQHEYGHFIGMGHCNENSTCDWGQAVMYASYSGGTMPPLFPDDVQGACALYPGQVGGFGYPCTAANSCNSNLCVIPSAGGQGFCSQTCGTCPDGYMCGPNPANASQQVCVRDDGTNKQLCEVCQPNVRAACANNGECVGGFPGNDGHCVVPCPNPGVPDGGCPNKYTCYSFQGGGNYCGPKSGDCGNLDNFTELDFGSACTGNPACRSPYDCIGICSQQCQLTNPASCPSGYACETFQFQDQSGRIFEENWCARAVAEGDNCSGLTACTTGPCLGSGNDPAVCYLDCTTNANACNNAQTCERYRVGNQTVGVCEPAGVPPNPVIDAGMPPERDAGSQSTPDSGYDGGVPGCACDVSAACDLGCNCDTRCAECACDTTLGCDQGCECDTTCGACACDTDYCCSENCACDQECQCACDVFFGCDEGCACDSECDPACPNYAGPVTKDCNCQTTPGASTGAPVFGLALAMFLFGRALFRSRRG